MNRNEQIKEMARYIWRNSSVCLIGEAENIAEMLFNAGFRKLDEVENISTLHPVDGFVCSKCGVHLEEWTRVVEDMDDGDIYHYEYRIKYCPECGAKVKGD